MKKSLLTAALSVGLALSAQNAFANQAPLSDAAKDCIIAKQQQQLQANRIGAANAGTALGFLPDWFFIATSANLELNASIADVQREMPKILKVLETSDDISDAMRSQVIAQFKAMQDKFADQRMEILAITRMMGNKSGPNASLYETIASVLADIKNADMKDIFDDCGAQNTKEIEKWLASVLASPNDDEDENVTAKACDPEDRGRAVDMLLRSLDLKVKALELDAIMSRVILEGNLEYDSSVEDVMRYFSENNISGSLKSEFDTALNEYLNLLYENEDGDPATSSTWQPIPHPKEVSQRTSDPFDNSMDALRAHKRGDCDFAKSLLDEI